MRGKTIDTEFVIEFIQECAEKEKLTPEDICKESLKRIAEIDEHLKKRTKFMDVLSFFNYKKKHALEDQEVSFERIDKKIAEEIIDLVRSNNHMDVNKLLEQFFSLDINQKQELIFTLKQMFEMKILYRHANDTISYGQNFEMYEEKE